MSKEVVSGIKRDGDSIRSRSISKRFILSALVLIAGLSLAAPSNFFSAEQLLTDVDLSDADASWQADLISRLSRGELAGRDFYFTYGPLYQLTHAAGLLGPQGDLASLLRFRDLPEAVLTAIFVWYLLSLTGASLIWRSATYLLWVLFWPPVGVLGTVSVAGIKPMAGLLCLAVCGRCLMASEGKKEGLINPRSAMLWALSTPLLTLYSFDMGVVTLVALTLAAVTILVCARASGTKPARATWYRTICCMSLALLGVATFVTIVSLNAAWSYFLSNSLEMASSYPVRMALGLKVKELAAIIAAAFCVCGLIIFISRKVVMTWRAGFAPSHRAIVLLASGCFCLIWLRYGLTRSSQPHVLTALVPTIFFIGALVPCYLRAEGARILGAVSPALSVPVILLMVGAFPPGTFSVGQRLRAIYHLRPDQARLEISGDAIDEAVSSTQKLPGDSLYVWPYQALVNVLSGKINPAYTVQHYAALTGRLEHATIERLASQDDMPVIIFTDKVQQIDGVENFTRTPHLFQYLLYNYESDGPMYRSFILLRRSPPRKRQWYEQELPVGLGKFVPGGSRSLSIDLSPENNSDLCRASELVLLQLRASRTPFYGIGKPGQVLLTFSLSNGEQHTRKLLLPPDGEPHNILASATPSSHPLFYSVFSASQLWRSSERVVKIEIRWVALDVLSVRPREIALERLSVLKRQDVEVVESSVTNQNYIQRWNK